MQEYIRQNVQVIKEPSVEQSIEYVNKSNYMKIAIFSKELGEQYDRASSADMYFPSLVSNTVHSEATS